MKLFRNVIIAATVLASISVDAQDKTKNAKTQASRRAFEQGQNPVVEFKKRNKDVKSVHWKQGNIIVIEKTDGTVEKYSLDVATEKEKATSLYGELPIAPPPPPAPQVAPPPPPPPVPAPAETEVISTDEPVVAPAPPEPVIPPSPPIPAKSKVV
jgi:hypothetical protein